MLRVCDYDDLVTEFTECNAGSRHAHFYFDSQEPLFADEKT